MQCQQLSRLMFLSWEIQRKKKYNRAKSLMSAWAIVLNEDITIYYLVKKHSHVNHRNRININNLSLFF